MSVFSIQGTVVGVTNGETVGLVGVRVVALEAIDAAAQHGSLLLSATTEGPSGAFTLGVSADEALRLFRSHAEDDEVGSRPISTGARMLSLVAYRGGEVIATASLTVTLDGLAAGYSVRLVASAGAPALDGLRVVHGRVVDEAGTAVRGVVIELLRRELRTEVRVAQTTSGFDGSYRLAFQPGVSAPAAALLVRAVRGTAEIARSPIAYERTAVLDLDLVIPGPLAPTELDALAQRIGPVLGSVAPQSLTDAELAHVVLVAELPAPRVTRYVQALRLSTEHAAPLYALSEAGVPLRWGSVAVLREEQIDAMLRSAAARRIVPEFADPQAAARALADAARRAAEGPGTPFGELREQALGRTAVPLFDYAGRSGDAAAFWADIERVHGRAATDLVVFGIQVDTFTGHHVPLVARLVEMRASATIGTTRDLVAFTRARWRALLDAPGVGAPAGFPGDTEDARRDLYAAALARGFEDAFPTTALVERVAASGRWTRASSYLATHPELDMRSTLLRRFVADHPPAGAQAELLAELRTVQRMFMVAPAYDRHESATALLDAGLTSAHAIVELGRSGFMARLDPALGPARAAILFDNAHQVVATTSALLLRHAAVFNPFQPAALGDVVYDPGDATPPDLPGLFGPHDFCACEDCRSVLGPAAYLVDILRFVENQPTLAGDDDVPARRPFSVLLEHRPDLVQILLECRNTNTPMPMIDLVNEILEREVAGITPTSWPQTTRTSEELRAHPEHVLAAAYTELRGAVYPWNLPFDLPLAEARVYLRHLGAPLVRLLDVAMVGPGRDDARARERLGLSPQMARIVAAESVGAAAHEFWGVGPVAWEAGLADLRTFMARSGLTLAEVEDAARTRYLGDGAVAIDFERPCVLDGATLTALDATRLGRVHRLVRLRAATGWSFFELDAALAVVGSAGAEPLDAAAVRALAGVVRLAERFEGADRLELLAWFGRLETRRPNDDARSFYERVFVEPSAATDPSPFAAGRPVVALASVVPELAAALRLREDEVRLLLARPAAPTTSTLPALSWLYRWSSLARALGLGVGDLATLADLAAVPLFAGVGPVEIDTIDALIGIVEVVGTGATAIARLDWILRHRASPGTQPALADAAIAEEIVDLVRGLQTVRAELQASVAAERNRVDVLAEKLRQILAEPDVAALLALVQEAPTAALPAALVPTPYVEFLSQSSWDALRELPAPGDPLATPAGRADAVLIELVPYLERRAMADVVTQKLAAAMGLSAALTRELLARPTNGSARIDAFVGASAQLVDAIDFASDAAWIASAEFPATLQAAVGEGVFDTFRWLHAIGQLAASAALQDDDIRWLYAAGPSLGLVDLDALPLGALAGAAPQWPGVLALLRLVRVADRCLGGLVGARAVLGATAAGGGAVTSELRRTLAVVSGWEDPDLPDDASAIAEVVAHLGLSQDDLRGAAGFEALADVFELARRLGVAATRLVRWADPADVTFATAAEIKAVAKAKHEPSMWPGVAEPLRDALREQQRDALVAHVLASGGDVRNADDLFGRFLIDVSVSACVKTSRINQAIGAVQSFVQRMTLSLEPGVHLARSAEAEWTWMKRYRVWEANRKIFLHPENWLEPELRDDKTELFAAFEQQLLEGELSDANVERAFIAYLEGLDTLGGLRIGGMYHEREVADGGEPAIDRMHVFGRTQSKPYRYHYRTRVDDSYWTPWTAFPHEVKSPGVAPVVFDRRLMLFWPDIMRQKQELASANADLPPDVYDVRLRWCELRDRTWSDAYATEEVIRGQVKPPQQPTRRADAASRFFLRAAPDTSGALIVELSFADLARDLYRHFRAWVIDGCNAEPVRTSTSTKTTGIHMVFHLGSMHAEWFPAPLWGIQSLQSFHMDVGDMAHPENVGLTMPVRSHHTGSVSTREVFSSSPRPWRVVVPMQYDRYVSQSPFFYQDRDRVLYVVPRHGEGGGKTLTLATRGEAPVELESLAAFTLAGAVTSTTESISALASAPTPALGPVLEPFERWSYRCDVFSHPWVCRMLALVRRHGVDALFDPPQGDGAGMERQTLVRALTPVYEPAEHVTVQAEQFDFSFGGACSVYNWELYLHAPMFMALRLKEEQRFAEAQAWMHCVFDPTAGGTERTPARYWRIKPLYDIGVTSVDEQLAALQYDGSDPARVRLRDETIAEIAQWRKNPFRPHALARLRVSAYQRWVVMRYLDNLVEWADSLFRQDTIESNNEALQLYILAAEILGPRPIELPSDPPPARTYAQVQGDIDPFGNFVADAENEVGFFATLKPTSSTFALDATLGGDEPPVWAAFKGAQVVQQLATGAEFRAPAPVASFPLFPKLVHATPGPDGDDSPRLYFCVPPNDELLRYWDLVADRLFKLRNCLNIEGVFRQLPLFQPPIDPAMLARAAAAGIDLATALSDLAAPLPHYRFRTMIEIAKELAAEVRGFGLALLEVLRNRDAEGLVELRAQHEVALLHRLTRARQLRIDEQEAVIAALREADRHAKLREDFYASREYRSRLEQTSEVVAGVAGLLTAGTAGVDLVGAMLAFIPDFKFGFNGMGPEVTASIGGAAAHRTLGAVSSSMRAFASALQTASALIATEAGFKRRDDLWKHEVELARQDRTRIAAEIAAAEIRRSIATRELGDHEFQTTQSEQVQAYLAGRYTTTELYRWLSSELSRSYFQAYQLAYDIAKQAERCYRYELGTSDAQFIEFGYWDNRRKGLLAGERLLHDLRRMETAYLANHRREYELRKVISLAKIDPVALLMLRSNGTCDFAVPEVLFELDHPSHFMRRIRSVRVTFAAVTGPFDDVPATLTLTRSAVRTRAESYADPSQPVDDIGGATQTIATSHAEGDAGVFEDGRHDDRYLPFEGKGVISRWHLELPAAVRPFDFASLTDVILEIRYTAREGGGAFAAAVLGPSGTAMRARLEQLPHAPGAILGDGAMQMWSFARDFPVAWSRFVEPDEGDPHRLEIELPAAEHPIPLAGQGMVVQRAVVLFVASSIGGPARISAPDATALAELPIAALPPLPGVMATTASFASGVPAIGAWSIEVADVDPSALADAFLVLVYGPPA